MNRFAFVRRIAPAVLVLMTACAAPKETAVVVERATRTEKPPSTEETVSAPRPNVELTPFPAGYDTVRARRFDAGKMWTFEHPPVDYFEQAYGFRPDSTWLDGARLAALRFSTYCSASFVSPNGLVMTNHHCGRESVTEVDPKLLDGGFYASSLDLERKVKDLYVDQLVDLKDVTEEVYDVPETLVTDDERAKARQRNAEALEKRLTDEVKAQDSTLYVQVIELYNGGKYSAYTYRRYDDVRLVMAPELQIGYFGGDWDNFTYPRYNLDMSFFRVYGKDGKPLRTEHYFPWSDEGPAAGEAVFVVGNPGSTSRLSTVSQLEYERDYNLPQSLSVLESRGKILYEYISKHPDEADRYDLRNPYFSISNSIKAQRGQLEGLRDPYLIARRVAGERDLQQAVAASDSLQKKYGKVWAEIAQLQESKRATSEQSRALKFFSNTNLSSHVLTRALYGYVYALMKQRGFPPDQIEEVYSEAVKIKDWPAEVEKAFISARLNELLDVLGPVDPTMKRILGDRSPEEVATELVDSTALMDSTAYRAMLEAGFLRSGDPVVKVIEAIGPLYFTLNQQLQNFEDREKALDARLARLRFLVFGTDTPPDATFSLRIADGVVRGYPYNGTKAPAVTTFFGLYDRFYSFPGRREWALPDYWLDPPETFDPSTPVNLVTTNDITGGNSGSPLVNRDLEIVGLIFDGNIESLPNQYIYTDETARAVAVDARGILEALDEIYDADRIVLELRSGKLVPTEEEADAVTSSRD